MQHLPRRPALLLVLGLAVCGVAVGSNVVRQGTADAVAQALPASTSPSALPDSVGGAIPSPSAVARAESKPTVDTSTNPPPRPSRTLRPSSPAASPSGMPATDLPGWRLLFNDDFQTDVARGRFPGPLFTKWGAYPSPWRDTSKRGTYSPEVVSVHDGLMDIHLHTVEGVIKVAAPLPLIHGRGGSAAQLYGRYAVRFRADAVTGYKMAWLLWPESGRWPQDGEIDFPEGNLDGTIHGFVHRQGATTGADQDIFPTTASFTDWHTAVIEWAPDRCEFFLDGVSLGKATDRIPETAMHWVIQTETALTGDAPAPAAEGHVYLDWVAVWAYAP